VSEKAGVGDSKEYYGLAAVFADVNNDGKVDLIVANDSCPNYLYLNKGDGTFEDASYASGYALNENGRETASMGIGVGDYLNNGSLDLYNSVFSDDYNPLYRNDGNANFDEVSYQAGVAEPDIPFLAWGNGFLDYDNDGWKDLFVANGHVYPGVDDSEWGTTFAQRPLLFHNQKNGKFEMVAPVKGTGLAELLTSRGAAMGDLFNDGKVDVVVNQIDRRPALLRNVSPDKNHWVGLKLIGGPKSPRDAIGAAVYVTAGGIRQRVDVFAGGSYSSSHDPRPHFGLGTATTIDKVEIHWPSGAIERVSLPSVDRFYAVEEGKGVVSSVYDQLGQKPGTASAASPVRKDN
jgi:enediyne biosynthesis protein E4